MNWREFQTKQQVAEVGERFVSFVEEGEGEPVVLLHGIPTWGYLWHGIIARLAGEGRRVLVPDLAGFGFSDKSDRFDRSIRAQAELVDQWMAAIGVERAAVVAHDIGGGVALRLAALFPARVRRLAVMNGVCYDSWPIEMMLQLGHPEANRKLSASTLCGMLRQALKSGFATSPPDEVLDAILAPWTTEVGKLSLIRAAAALNTNLTTELTPLLPQITVPALVLWGMEDKFQLAEYGRRLAWDLPQARFVPVENARHFLMIDQPEIVGQHLSAFL